MTGKQFKLKDFKGKKPVYLKFWATWCQPCRKQMPHFQHTYEKFSDKVEIISVNLGINDNMEEVLKTKKEFGLTMPIVIDNNARLFQGFNLIGTPYHILLDRNGDIVYSGHDITDKLNSTIVKLAANTSEKTLPVNIHAKHTEDVRIDRGKSNNTILFFTSAWCDWYLEKSRPNMSANCIAAQHLINDLYVKYPKLNWQGLLTRLWTGDKELAEFQKKHQIQYPLKVDETNNLFFKYKVKYFPTIIALNGEKELFRLQNFSDAQLVYDKFKQFQ